MGVEIERKFLVLDDGWRAASLGALPIRQGYLSRDGALTLRVRLYCDQAYLTLKSQEIGLVRAEFEYEIPVTDAENLLAEHCRRPLITKLRHQVRWAGRDWVVDVFEGARAGLVLAEIELAHPDEDLVKPPWAGREVTLDPAYHNSNL